MYWFPLVKEVEGPVEACPTEDKELVKVLLGGRGDMETGLSLSFPSSSLGVPGCLSDAGEENGSSCIWEIEILGPLKPEEEEEGKELERFVFPLDWIDNEEDGVGGGNPWIIGIEGKGFE